MFLIMLYKKVFKLNSIIYFSEFTPLLMYLPTLKGVKVLEINNTSYNIALIAKVPFRSIGVGLSYSEDEVLFTDPQKHLWRYVYC